MPVYPESFFFFLLWRGQMKTNASKEKQIAQNPSYARMKVLLPIAPPPCIFRLLGKVLDCSAMLAGIADCSSTPSRCRSKSPCPAPNWSAALLRSTARTPSPLPSFAQMCWGFSAPLRIEVGV